MQVETSKPIDELSELEALVLINRWVKLRQHFFYDDRDALYDLKDNTLKRFLAEGIVHVSKVVRRETQAIAGMKVEIANNGLNLDWLDYCSNNYYGALKSLPGAHHYEVLSDLANGCYEVPVRADEYDQLEQEWQIKHQEYLEIARQYKEVKATINAVNSRYQQELEAYQNKQYLAFYEYLCGLDLLNGEDKQVLTFLKTNKRTPKQQKRIDKAISRHQFLYSDSPPIKPGVPKLKQPQQPVKPSSTTYLAPDEYVPGSHQEIDAAIAWAKKFMCRPDLQASDIDDNFICFELEPALADEALEALRQQAIAIFKQVVSCELKDPRIIWDKLTDFPLDYEAAIGSNGR